MVCNFHTIRKCPTSSEDLMLGAKDFHVHSHGVWEAIVPRLGVITEKSGYSCIVTIDQLLMVVTKQKHSKLRLCPKL